MTPSIPKPVTNNKDDDGAIDGDIMGEVILAIHPQCGYPAELTSLAEHLNTPNLPWLVHQFLFDQLQPNDVSEDKQLWENLPDTQPQFSVFHLV
ncbi:hypothetical protein EI94DRAFT_1802752 [Lactarius quietus]|nr:hypothetical protein EI94DRAFT_1802752 [Lactarius quietus]